MVLPVGRSTLQEASWHLQAQRATCHLHHSNTWPSRWQTPAGLHRHRKCFLSAEWTWWRSKQDNMEWRKRWRDGPLRLWVRAHT